jgi:hypothetical protein
MLVGNEMIELFTSKQGEINLLERDYDLKLAEGTENFFVKDSFEGLNQFTGWQMLQCALENCLEDGYLAGAPYYSTTNSLRLGPRPFEVRMVAIGEPGGKTRPVSVGVDLLTILLSPFGHQLKDLLSFHEHARAGLTAAAQGFEAAKSLAYTKFDTKSSCDRMFLSCDLTQASEFLEHRFSMVILKEFCLAVGCATPYMLLCIDILCSGRYIESAETKDYKFVGKLTLRASLMGDPGTKALLTLTVLCCENLAWYETDKSLRFFRGAGDDMLAIGKIEYLSAIIKWLQLVGGKINLDMAYISPIGSYFCEELILKTDCNKFSTGNRIPFFRLGYDQTVHVDGLKVRNFSRCVKVTRIKEEKNPAVGKLTQLNKMCDWLPYYYNRGYRDLVFYRIKDRLGKMIDWESPMTFLPRVVGGLELQRPSFIKDEDLYESFFKLPEQLQICICKAIRDGMESLDVQSRRALRGYSSNKTYRGIQVSHIQEEAYKRIFRSHQFQLDDVKLASIVRDRLQIPLTRWADLRYRDKMNKLETIGLIPISRALEQMNRPAYFKRMLTSIDCVFEKDPAYTEFNETISELDRLCETEDSTWFEQQNLSSVEWTLYERARNAWFSRKKELEEESFNFRIDPDELQKSSKDLRSEKGFNSTPLIYRPKVIERQVRRHNQYDIPLEERRIIMRPLVDETETSASYGVDTVIAEKYVRPVPFKRELPDRITFVKKSFFSDLVSLRTELPLFQYETQKERVYGDNLHKLVVKSIPEFDAAVASKYNSSSRDGSAQDAETELGNRESISRGTVITNPNWLPQVLLGPANIISTLSERASSLMRRLFTPRHISLRELLSHRDDPTALHFL